MKKRAHAAPGNGLTGSSAPASNTGAAVSNIHAIIKLERETQEGRTALERITDAVSAAASSTSFIVVHVVWFAVWIGLNTLTSRQFDPFPFSFLTLVVSLEAIILTAFVLMSQNRMTEVADQRSQLDLQINVLAEQELTAILKVLALVADKVGVDARACEPRIAQLLGETNVEELAHELSRELKAIHHGEKGDTGKSAGNRSAH